MGVLKWLGIKFKFGKGCLRAPIKVLLKYLNLPYQFFMNTCSAKRTTNNYTQYHDSGEGINTISRDRCLLMFITTIRTLPCRLMFITTIPTLPSFFFLNGEQSWDSFYTEDDPYRFIKSI